MVTDYIFESIEYFLFILFFDTSLMLLCAHHTEITVMFDWVLKINSLS